MVQSVRPVDMKETSQCLLLDRDGEMGQARTTSLDGRPWKLVHPQLAAVPALGDSLGQPPQGLHSFSGGLPPAQGPHISQSPQSR